MMTFPGSDQVFVTTFQDGKLVTIAPLAIRTDTPSQQTSRSGSRPSSFLSNPTVRSGSEELEEVSDLDGTKQSKRAWGRGQSNERPSSGNRGNHGIEGGDSDGGDISESFDSNFGHLFSSVEFEEAQEKARREGFAMEAQRGVDAESVHLPTLEEMNGMLGMGMVCFVESPGVQRSVGLTRGDSDKTVVEKVIVGDQSDTDMAY